MLAIGMIVSAEPAPKPAAVRPAARPRLSGNHFKALPTAVPYTMPAPTPPTAIPTYSIHRSLAVEFKTHDRPTRTPPIATSSLGPNRSTRYPSNGTSQV